MKGLAVSAAVLVFVLLIAKPTTSQGTTQACETVLHTVQNIPTTCATASTSNCIQNITASTCSCCKQANSSSDACCTAFLAATQTYSQTCNNVQVSADLSSLATIVKDCASSPATCTYTNACEAVLCTVQSLRTTCATAGTSNCVQNITANTCSCCKQANSASDACCTAFLTATQTYSQTCNNVQVSADLSSLATIVKDCASSAATHVTFIGSGLMGLVTMLIWLLL